MKKADPSKQRVPLRFVEFVESQVRFHNNKSYHRVTAKVVVRVALGIGTTAKRLHRTPDKDAPEVKRLAPLGRPWRNAGTKDLVCSYTLLVTFPAAG